MFAHQSWLPLFTFRFFEQEENRNYKRNYINYCYPGFLKPEFLEIELFKNGYTEDYSYNQKNKIQAFFILHLKSILVVVDLFK